MGGVLTEKTPAASNKIRLIRLIRVSLRESDLIGPPLKVVIQKSSITKTFGRAQRIRLKGTRADSGRPFTNGHST
jgi:hypothetical protein